jgi:hypothetical protein
LPVVFGCSALPVSAMLRSPVDNKGQSYGLKGCPELVEGAIAYADGNKALGMQKLEAARALNTPEQLKPFAEALRTIGKTGPDAAAPLVTVADILVPPMTAAVAAPALASGPATTASTASAARPSASRADEEEPGLPAARNDPYLQPILLALTASTDLLRLFTKTATVKPGEINCEVSGDPATCGRQQEGPVVITDVVASPGCGDRAYLINAFSDTTGFGHAWVVPASTPGIHGARLVVKAGEWLHIGARPVEKAAVAKGACFVTWSGFRPRLVPNKLGD